MRFQPDCRCVPSGRFVRDLVRRGNRIAGLFEHPYDDLRRWQWKRRAHRVKCFVESGGGDKMRNGTAGLGRKGMNRARRLATGSSRGLRSQAGPAGDDRARDGR